MPRFIITIRDRINPGPIVRYVGKAGFAVSTSDKASISKTLDEAKKEIDYYRKTCSPGYKFTIEQLATGKLAFLATKDIDY